MVHLIKLIPLLLAFVLLLGTAASAGCGGDDASDASLEEEPAGTEAEEAPDDGASAGTFELTVAHFFPAGHAIETDVVQPWGEAVSEATNGNVTITSYPGSTLLEGPEIYEGITKSVADVGISAYGFNAGRFPVVEAFMLPGIDFGSSVEAGRALTEGIERLDPEELQDTHHLMSFASGPGHLMMKTDPIRSLDDLQGLEIAATSGVVGDALQLLGATPVVMPIVEVYEAQSRGVVQGIEVGYEALRGFKLMDVTEYITATPFLYRANFFMAMNSDTWESLPAEYQEAISQVAAEIHEATALELFDELDEAALDATIQEKDPEMITLSEEEVELWKAEISPILDDYEVKLNEQGLDGETILSTVRELAEKHNQ